MDIVFGPGYGVNYSLCKMVIRFNNEALAFPQATIPYVMWGNIRELYSVTSVHLGKCFFNLVITVFDIWSHFLDIWSSHFILLSKYSPRNLALSTLEILCPFISDFKESFTLGSIEVTDILGEINCVLSISRESLFIANQLDINFNS